jgi:cytochrome c553
MKRGLAVRGFALAAALMTLNNCSLLQRLAGAPRVEPTQVALQEAPVAPAPVTATAFSDPMLSHPVIVSVPEPMSVSPMNGAGVFAANCAACHGANGRGYGPQAANFPVKPLDLTTLSMNHGGTFPARRVITAVNGISGGYHQGLVPAAGGSGVVEWITPAGEAVMTSKSMMDMLIYLESIQI